MSGAQASARRRHPRWRWPWLLAASGGGALAFAVIVGARSYSYVHDSLRPPRVAVPLPPPLPGLRSVTFESRNGTPLRGWYVPSRNGAAVVLGHGHGGNRAQLLPELMIVTQAGFGALAFDWPAHGQSGGTLSTWGDRERPALQGALDFVSAQADVDPSRIGVHGFSMGAVTALEVAAMDQRVKALSVTGPYPGLEEQIRYETGRWGPFSQLPALYALSRAGVDVAGVHPSVVACKLSPRPLLVISGAEDRVVPTSMEAEVYRAACEPKELWIMARAHHGDYATIAPSEYRERLATFFTRALTRASTDAP